MKKQFHAELMLVLVTFFWGLSFPVIKVATPFISPVLFVAVRFTIATLLLVAVWPLTGIKFSELLDKSAIKWGSMMGFLIAVGYASQTVGLHYTSPNNSAFITALSVVIVPFLLFTFHGIRLSKYLGAGVLLALSGLALMTRPDLGQLNRGDIWTLLSAFSYAVYLARLNYALDKVYYLNLLFWTLVSCTLFASMYTITIEQVYVSWNAEVIMALIVTATLCTLLGFYLHNRYQRFTTPTRAALIFSSEPVFAALFTWLVLHDGLSPSGFIGATLILGAVILAELGGAKQEGIKMRVLFICNANSCRSQMAETWARKLFPGDWACESAGLTLFPIVDHTRNAMQRVGLAMTGQKSKSIDTVNLESFDLIVTLSEESGHFLPNKVSNEKHFHNPVEDPMSFRGSDQEIEAAFDKGRDEIQKIVQKIITNAS